MLGRLRKRIAHFKSCSFVLPTHTWVKNIYFLHLSRASPYCHKEQKFILCVCVSAVRSRSLLFYDEGAAVEDGHGGLLSAERMEEGSRHYVQDPKETHEQDPSALMSRYLSQTESEPASYSNGSATPLHPPETHYHSRWDTDNSVRDVYFVSCKYSIFLFFLSQKTGSRGRSRIFLTPLGGAACITQTFTYSRWPCSTRPPLSFQILNPHASWLPSNSTLITKLTCERTKHIYVYIRPSIYV